MAKNFFKDEKERMLWVRLNAEHIQYFHKVVNHIDAPLGDINTPFSHMRVSLNQLEYDEQNSDAPRFTFEELVMPHDQLLKLSQEKERAKIKKMFGDTDGMIMLGDLDDEDLMP